MRNLAYVAVGGVVALAVIKLLLMLLSPVFGAAIGLFTTIFQLALVVGAVAVLWMAYKKYRRKSEGECC